MALLAAEAVNVARTEIVVGIDKEFEVTATTTARTKIMVGKAKVVETTHKPAVVLETVKASGPDRVSTPSAMENI